MLDINRLIAISFHVSSRQSVCDIKSVILSVAHGFEPDDVLLFDEQQADGSGEATALIANYQATANRDSTISSFKKSARWLCEMDTNSPKAAILILDDMAKDDVSRLYSRLCKSNEKSYYPAKFRFIEYKGVSDDVSDFVYRANETDELKALILDLLDVEN